MRQKRRKHWGADSEARISKFQAMQQEPWCNGCLEILRILILPLKRSRKCQMKVEFQSWKLITGSLTPGRGLWRVISFERIELLSYIDDFY